MLSVLVGFCFLMVNHSREKKICKPQSLTFVLRLCTVLTVIKLSFNVNMFFSKYFRVL